VFDWFELNTKYFQTGFSMTTYVENAEVDYSSWEVQNKLNIFNDRLMKCDNCQQSWIKENTMSSWFIGLKKFVKAGDCTVLREGLDEEHHDHIRPEAFYPCLWEYLEDDSGKRYEDSIRYSVAEDPKDRKIIGY